MPREGKPPDSGLAHVSSAAGHARGSLARYLLYEGPKGDYTMKKMIEKIVDAMLELVAGSFEIDPCNLRDEDMLTGTDRLGEAVG